METGWVKTLLTPEVVRKSLDVLLSGLIVLLAVVLSRVLKRWLDAAMQRTRIKDDLLLRSFFLRMLSIVTIIIGALVALRVLGLDVTSFVAGLGVTGIILGFGFKDVLSNLAAGMLLLIYRPFRAGHMIEVEGAQGTVEELTIVNMQMTTTDGVRVIMPNSKVWGAKIVNYSLSQQRRIESEGGRGGHEPGNRRDQSGPRTRQPCPGDSASICASNRNCGQLCDDDDLGLDSTGRLRCRRS